MLPDISVVVPMKNEGPNVDELYRELCDHPSVVMAL